MSAQATRALQLKIRRIVWTGAIASVTAVGAWYGAGLKIQSEEKKVQHSLTPETSMIKLLIGEDYEGETRSYACGKD
jgi:hypothetical protein